MKVTPVYWTEIIRLKHRLVSSGCQVKLTSSGSDSGSCLVFGQKSSTKGPRGTLPLGCVTDATPPTASPVGIVGRLVTMPTMEGEMTSFLATFL